MRAAVTASIVASALIKFGSEDVKSACSIGFARTLPNSTPG